MIKLDPAIPLPPTIGLLGRETELSRLKNQLLTSNEGVLAVLHGLPGVGKTTIASALAYSEEIQSHFQAGILWAGLGPEPNLLGLLSHWGSLLNISGRQMARLRSIEDWTQALRIAIDTRHMLLIIDDAWTIEEALTFKVGGQNCAHLVTTRFPALAGRLTINGAQTLHELGEEESIALLRLLAPQVMEKEEKKARTLVQAVGGLPLALTLMGNYLRKQAYTGQTRRISQALQRLSAAEERLHLSEPLLPTEGHPSLVSETSLSLRSIIAVTDQFLNKEARSALYALSTLPAKPNSYSEEVALAAADCPIETLDILSDTGLLESSSSGRYTLHQTIADYARLQLDHQAEKQAYERLIAYIAPYVELHRKDYELLDRESATILAILDISPIESQQTALLHIILAFSPFLLLRGLYAQAENYLQRAWEIAQQLHNTSGQASVLLYIADAAQKQGRLEQAEKDLQRGLDIARQHEDNERMCDLLTELGGIIWKRGNLTEAERFLAEGLPIARQLNDHERICALLKMLGLVALSRGEAVLSESYLQEGLSLARQLGDREQISVILMNLGVLAGDQGKSSQAEKYLLEGLAIARQIGDRERSSAILVNLGEVASNQQDYVQAESYYQEGLLLARQIGHHEWISILLISLATISTKKVLYQQAEIYLTESLQLARQLGRPQITANALFQLGNLYLQKQAIELAEHSFQEMASYISNEDPGLQALAQFGKARISAIHGNITMAKELGESSVEILEHIHNRRAIEIRTWLATLPLLPS